MNTRVASIERIDVVNRCPSADQIDLSKFRNQKGAGVKEFYNWPILSPSQMDGPLCVEQYVQQQTRVEKHNLDWLLNVPTIALSKTSDEPDPLKCIDEYGIWKYENVKQFCIELNELVVMLHGVCTMTTCPAMVDGSRNVYMCAGHPKPKDCSAMEYMHHTLDSASLLLTDAIQCFPSRMALNEKAVSRLCSTSRRLYRFLTHAYHFHREEFDEFEKNTSLAKRFTTFMRHFKMMKDDNLLEFNGAQMEEHVADEIRNVFDTLDILTLGEARFGSYRFMPIAFLTGALMELFLIKFKVGKVSFYNVYKEKQAIRIVEKRRKLLKMCTEQ